MIQEWGDVRSRKGLDTVQALLRNKKNISVLSILVSAQIQNMSPDQLL